MAARMTIAKKRQMVIQHMKLLENRRRRSDEADKLKVVNSQQIALTEELERIKERAERASLREQMFAEGPRQSTRCAVKLGRNAPRRRPSIHEA